MIISNGTIHDAIHEEAYQSDIAIRDGVITEIGMNIQPLENEEIIDATGMQIYPGLVEAHSHLGLRTSGAGNMGMDINEKSNIMTPYLRGIDGFYPQDMSVRKALEAGVTTVCAGPGSSNIIGGTFFVTKTYGSSIDKMVMVKTAAMKCAFGENPKNLYGTKGCTSRMTVTGKFREMLYLTQDYMLRKEAAHGDIQKMPKFDMNCEAMIPVLKGEIPLKAHAHRADDLCTAIRIAKEFDLKLTLEHCTEAAMIVEELQEAGYPLAVGPALSFPGKSECTSYSFETPGILARAGLSVSIITDHSVVPQENLPICAGLAVRAGMDPFAALQAITINPAKHIGVESRVGSIEVGKDGDVLVATGDIMLNSTKVKMVILNGKCVVNQ